MAGVSVRSVTLLASAGVGGAYLSNNMESVSRSLARVLRLNEARALPTGASNSSAMNAISEQVSALARDVSLSANRPVVVLGPGSSRVSAVADALAMAGWTTLAVSVGGVCYFFIVKGWRVADLAWVSQKSFSETVDAMHAGITLVRGAVASVRREVAERLRVVEAALAAQIEGEVSEVKEQIDGVTKEVQTVADVLADVNGRIDAIDGKLDTATHGIMALVRVVSHIAPDDVSPASPFFALKMLAADKTAATRPLSSGLGGILEF